jgi:capsular polysaccharide biosynthesis protein
VAVGNTLRFRGSRSLPDPTELSQQAVKLDFDVFIAVDAWWNNYYHWLCITLPKMLMAQAVETAGASRPVIPEYHDSVEPGGKPAFSKTVWEQSLAAFGLSDDVVRLPPGIYTSARVSTILVNHQQPAYFALFEQFVDVYARVCHGLRTDPDSPKRILVKRRADGRMTSEQSMLVETAALSHGFTPVHLEELDFVGQAELFFNAEAVIAAHGAGLSNIVFGGSGFRVLEVNRRLPPVEGHLRPWYSVIARAKGQYYSFLDADAGELERGKIESAVRKLCSGLPTARVA